MRKGILFTWLVAAVLALCGVAIAEPGDFLPGPDEFPGMEAKGSYLGIDPGEVTSDNVSALKLKEETGVEVKMVDQDAPAGKAGIKEHDVILMFNGQKVESVDQLRRMLAETPGGRTVKLTISREGQMKDVPVALMNRKDIRAEWKVGRVAPVPPVPPVGAVPMIAPVSPMEMRDFDFPPNINIVVQTTSRNGLMVESLTPQLAEYFGVKRGEGVLIRGVERGSAAARAGLRAGDVIVSVDKEQVSDVSDWRRVMRSKSGNVALGIIREKKQQTVPLKVPDRKTREQGALTAPDFEFNFSDMDVDMDEMRMQLDELKPQIREQTRMMAMELEKQRPQIEKAIRDVRKNMKEVEIDREKIRKEAEKARAELSKLDVEKIRREALTGIDKIDLEKMQKELKQQMEELQKNLREQRDYHFEMISY